MKVMLKTILAGPDGVLQPGEVEVLEKTGQALIAAGCAEAISSTPAKGKAVEVTTAEEPPSKKVKGDK